MRGAVAIVALGLFLVLGSTAGSCGGRNRGRDAGTTRPRPTFRIAFVTDLKGYLEPCGCTSRPLGGVHRLGGALDAARADGVPTAFVAVGDTFLEPNPSENRTTQDTLQAEALRDVLGVLGVKAVVPGRLDLGRGEPWLSHLLEGGSLPVLAAGPSVPAALGARPFAVLELGPVKLGLVAATDAFGLEGDALVAETLRSVGAARGAGATVVALLVRGDRRVARALAGLGGIDFVIHGGLDTEDPEPPTPRGDTLVFEGGRQGQRLVVVDVYASGSGRFTDASEWTRRIERARVERDRRERAEQLTTWRREGRTEAELTEATRGLAALDARLATLRGAAPSPAGRAIFADVVELAPGGPENGAIAARMDALGIAVNDHNRQAFADLAPDAPTEGMPTYVGTPACRTCHASAFAWWNGHPHSRAYETLVTRHREYNLACVGCHVTGYGKPGGATVTHNAGGSLVDVGCESCHGPGSEHAANPTGAVHGVVRAVPEAVCVRCHNHEHSDHFAYAAYIRAVVVPGHGLPSRGSP